MGGGDLGPQMLELGIQLGVGAVEILIGIQQALMLGLELVELLLEFLRMLLLSLPECALRCSILCSSALFLISLRFLRRSKDEGLGSPCA